MPDGLYDSDILIWSEQQADLLRRIAAGERLNEQVDWANVIEEVEAVGRFELHECADLLLRGVIHLLRLRAEPNSPDAADRRSDCHMLLVLAGYRFAPSMRDRLDLNELYATARKAVSAGPVTCPLGLDELLDDDLDTHALVARLNATA